VKFWRAKKTSFFDVTICDLTYKLKKINKTSCYTLAKVYTLLSMLLEWQRIMNEELSRSDFAEINLCIYEGFEITFKRTSNEVEARRGIL
jgi:hypothetical protein